MKGIGDPAQLIYTRPLSRPWVWSAARDMVRDVLILKTGGTPDAAFSLGIYSRELFDRTRWTAKWSRRISQNRDHLLSP